MPVHCVLVVLAEICLAQLNEISRSIFPGKSWKKTLKDFIWLPPGRFYSPKHNKLKSPDHSLSISRSQEPFLGLRDRKVKTGQGKLVESQKSKENSIKFISLLVQVQVSSPLILGVLTSS